MRPNVSHEHNSSFSIEWLIPLPLLSPIDRFKTQANLQRHKEYHHAGERFSCRTCGRVYPSNSTLKQHEIAHSNFRPHKCNICLKTFKRNQDLKFHTNQHTGAKPYQCPHCPRACKCIWAYIYKSQPPPLPHPSTTRHKKPFLAEL